MSKIKFLDFQIISSGSPVYDLSYFFYSGASGEAFEKLEHYLKIYYNSLTDTLHDFALDVETIYTFDKLKEEWIRYCIFGFALAILLWRIKLVDKEAVPDLTEYKDVDKIQPVKIAEEQQEKYKQIIRELVLHMHNNGFI